MKETKVSSPKVTYVVSAFNRPDSLPCCLWSLKVQTDPDFEVIVADNAIDPALQQKHQAVVRSLRDFRFRHVNTASQATCPGWDCYWSAEWIVENVAAGKWICLPSDDSYYVPIFQRALLDAAVRHDWKFVYSDMLYDRRLSGTYSPLKVFPSPCAIDKTGFLVRRDAWIGFPNKPIARPASSCCDGEMAKALADLVPHGKVPEILCVHN